MGLTRGQIVKCYMAKSHVFLSEQASASPAIVDHSNYEVWG